MTFLRGGVKTFSDPSYIFSRDQDPNPSGSTPPVSVSYSASPVVHYRGRWMTAEMHHGTCAALSRQYSTAG